MSPLRRSISQHTNEPSFPSTPQTLSPDPNRSKFFPLPQLQHTPDREENTIILSSDSESDDDDLIIIDNVASPTNPPLTTANSQISSILSPSNTQNPRSPSSCTVSTLAPHNYPLPNSSSESFDILRYAPNRNPSKPARSTDSETFWDGTEFVTEDERRRVCEREKERETRGREQRVLEEGEEGWGRKWECVGWEEPSGGGRKLARIEKGKGKGKGREKGKALPDFHSVEFFPYSKLEGLEWLDGVFATVGGGMIEIYRCPLVSGSNSSPTLLKRIKTPRPTSKDQPDREEYMTCSWSVNTTTWPFTPMLAVAGRGRVIEIYLLGQNGKGELVVKLDRTITGHGGTIHQLKFHPNHPHLLMSCSEDRMIRLWDPTVPWGSDKAVKEAVDEATRAYKLECERKGKKGKGKRKRAFTMTEAFGKEGMLKPRVDGELLAILAGQEKAVFSCDFHSHYPLVVSGGADGRIRLWLLPSSILSSTPTWPTPPHLNKHPPPPSLLLPLIQPPLLSPFFSTIHLHPGQWPCNVSFIDQSLTSPSSTVHIISSAPLTHQDSATIPRTSVKISAIDCLSLLPNSTYIEHFEKVDQSRSQAYRSFQSSATNVQETVPVKARLPERERDDLGFHVEKEIILETQTCIGDSFGLLRTPPFLHSPNTPSEPFFVVSTTMHLPSTSSPSLRPALYFYRPFPPPSPIPLGPQTLFPLNRDRTQNDFHPRLQPSLVLDFPEEEENERGGVRHFRSLAISPDGGGWIVGVGDRGLRGVWREVRERKGRERMDLEQE